VASGLLGKQCGELASLGFESPSLRRAWKVI